MEKFMCLKQQNNTFDQLGIGYACKSFSESSTLNVEKFSQEVYGVIMYVAVQVLLSWYCLSNYDWSPRGILAQLDQASNKLG